MSGPQRIGIDARGMQQRPTGLGNYLSRLLEPLARQHPQTEFILYSNMDMPSPAAANITLRQSEKMHAAPYWLHHLVPRALKRDGVQVFWGAIGYVPVLGCPCPRVLTLHDFVYHFAPRSMRLSTRWNRALFQRLSTRVADKTVAVSHATAADARRLFGITIDDVIPPLTSDDFGPQARLGESALRSKLSLPASYLLCVATFEPRKNLEAMVSGYLEARRAGSSLPTLVLAGSVGWRSGSVHDLVERAVHAGFVQRLGFVDTADLPPLYAGAHVSILPSVYEGFGMPLTEAQLCGAPVMHGEHDSMVEAAGGLGVAIGSSPDAWRAAFTRLAAGEVPLACRLSGDIVNRPEASARRMWGLLDAAYRSAA